MKTETIKSYLKILLSLIKLENKLSLIQALKINTVWRVTRLQSKKKVDKSDTLSHDFLSLSMTIFFLLHLSFCYDSPKSKRNWSVSINLSSFCNTWFLKYFFHVHYILQKIGSFCHYFQVLSSHVLIILYLK